VDCDPRSALFPDHEPNARHTVALLADQERVDPAPALTVLGSTVKVICGASGATVTVTDWVADPPGPEQVSSNSVVRARAPVDHVPLVATAPLQPPEAVHEVAFSESHRKRDVPPVDTVVGNAARVTPGAAEVTTTSAD